MEQPDDNASFFFAPLQECSISHYLALGITVCAVFAARALFRSDGVSQYPMFGQELGGYSKRRQHFLRRPAESVQEGYRKVRRRPDCGRPSTNFGFTHPHSSRRVYGG